MIAIQVGCNINIDKVTIFQFPIIWNSVTNDFIDRRTAGFREPVIIERRRIRTGLSRSRKGWYMLYQ
jgi:hypothetical protein